MKRSLCTTNENGRMGSNEMKSNGKRWQWQEGCLTAVLSGVDGQWPAAVATAERRLAGTSDVKLIK